MSSFSLANVIRVIGQEEWSAGANGTWFCTEFWSEYLNGNTRREWRIILKRVLEQGGVSAWVLSIWLSVKANGGLIWTRIRSVWFLESREFLDSLRLGGAEQRIVSEAADPRFNVTGRCVGLDRSDCSVCLCMKVGCYGKQNRLAASPGRQTPEGTLH